jgi:hypothetical protein
MNESDWVKVLISWVPFILLIGFWLFFLYFMKRGGTKVQREYIERHKEHMAPDRGHAGTNRGRAREALSVGTSERQAGCR